MPVSAARSGWATLPSLRPVSSAKVRTAASSAVGASSARPLRAAAAARPSVLAPGRRAASPPCRRARAAASANRKAALSSSSTSVLARSFRPGMARRACASRPASIRAASAAPSGSSGSSAFERVARARASRRGADVVAVQVLELGEIEARGRAPDRVEIEPLDHLLGRHDLVVAVAPAEPHEIVAQAPPADSPWRDRPRRRARRGASTAWRRRARGSAARARRSACPSPSP